MLKWIKRIEIKPHMLSDHNPMKLKIKGKRNHRNYANIWRLKVHLNKKWVTEEIKEDIRSFTVSNNNATTVYQNILDTITTDLSVKLIAFNSHSRKKAGPNNQMVFFKVLEKKQPKSKATTKTQKWRVEINEYETKKIQIINE